MLRYAIDFQTVGLPRPAVVSISALRIDNPQERYRFSDIFSFLMWAYTGDESRRFYIHDLKFFARFLTIYLNSDGYKCVDYRRDSEAATYTLMVNSLGDVYSVDVYPDVSRRKLTFYNAQHLLPFPYEELKTNFGYQDKTNLEALAAGLKELFNLKIKGISISAASLRNYRETMPNFNYMFPKIDAGAETLIRQSYRGGYNYLKKDVVGQTLTEGTVIDANSLYPSIMIDELMPYGVPIPFKGKYENDPNFPLFIQRFTCSFELKPGKQPYLQIKNSFRYNPTEYLSSSHGEIEALTMTNSDLQLFLDNYDVENLTYQFGYKFKGRHGLFSNYLEHWGKIKEKSRASNHKAHFMLSKLMMNSLYGRFGLNRFTSRKIPEVGDGGKITWRTIEDASRDGVYTPVAAFVTSYGRKRLLDYIHAIDEKSLRIYGRPMYIYGDTDSLHLLGQPYEVMSVVKDIVPLDPVRIGAWKIETQFSAARYLKQKCYCLQTDKGYKAIVAGLPKTLTKEIKLEDFVEGFDTAVMRDLVDPSKMPYKIVDTPTGPAKVPIDYVIK